ncbi:hypothetical protein UlMin_004730 [Ulmus minor]
MHQLLSSLPHQALRNLAKRHGPLMYLKLGQVPTLVVSSAEFAKEVMKTHDVIFASRPQILASKIMSYDCTNIAFAPYGEYWKQLRKICIQELLSPARVNSFKPIRAEELSNLVSWIASNTGSAINLTRKIFWLTYSITSRAAFGKKSKEQEEFISIVAEAIKVGGGFELADMFPSVSFLHLISGIKPKLERLHKEADRIMEGIISEHKKEKEATKSGGEETQEDLVDVLLKFHKQSEVGFSLTNDNIKAVILDIFGAGSETSSTTVDWAMAEMIRKPEVMKRAQEEVREVFNRRGLVDETGIIEMKYLKSVVKETLRLHPPGPLLLPRQCGENCVINGYEIPVKTRVVINAWAIGRDPKNWNNADSFIPERFLDCSIDYKGSNFEFIPFGAGRRICPGISFGIVNVELPLALLLYHFDWELPSGMAPEELNMNESFGVTVQRKDDLLLIPSAYYP